MTISTIAVVAKLSAPISLTPSANAIFFSPCIFYNYCKTNSFFTTSGALIVMNLCILHSFISEDAEDIIEYCIKLKGGECNDGNP